MPRTGFNIPRAYAQKYTNVCPISSSGHYGVVCSATRSSDGADVCIKKLEYDSVFNHLTYLKRTIREFRLLRMLRHDNVVALYDCFTDAESKDDLMGASIFVVAEMCETDLACILKSDQTLSDAHYKFFIYQVFRALKYIHSAGVVHRDLKPRNLLVNSSCDLKIGDFGLARVKPDGSKFGKGYRPPMTDYVCTRWYRAPEVLCNWNEYSSKVDIWSAGCIFAELVLRKPLFPGVHTCSQFELIIGALGFPNEKAWKHINNKDKVISLLRKEDLSTRTCGPILRKIFHAYSKKACQFSDYAFTNEYMPLRDITNAIKQEVGLELTKVEVDSLFSIFAESIEGNWLVNTQRFSFALDEELSMLLGSAGASNASLEAEMFVERILEFNPDLRPTAAECLRQPYLSDYHQEIDGEAVDEPTRPLLNSQDFFFDFPHMEGKLDRVLPEELWRELELDESEYANVDSSANQQ